MSLNTVKQLLLVTLFLQIHIAEAGFCNHDQFKCNDGKCIAEAKFCDGRFDCIDKSDETNCDLKQCHRPGWYQCDVAHGPCLSPDLICNGIENCPDGQDERNCAIPQGGGYLKNIVDMFKRKCSQYEFTCKSDFSCIPLDFICDGKFDCWDGSDELAGCVSAASECKGFFCHNERCLESKAWLCDGVDDCGDGSDEFNCAVFCTPEMGKFLCDNNRTCLPLEKACDGKNDCLDGSDESPRCTAAYNCTVAKCSPASKCQMMPQTGAMCICPKGFRHSVDKEKCVDINECSEQYGACSQICINAPGLYRCACANGYRLKEDNRTCEAIGEEALLLYTTQLAVMGVKLGSRRVYTIAKDLANVIGVAYNGEHIYWTNLQHEGESIVKANANGSQPEILLTSGLEAPEDLAIDWLTGNIYFSDNVMHHIAVCSNNGHYCTALVTDDVHQPRGVALWPQRSQIFWSDWGATPNIARASMDGKNRRHLVTENVHWPNSIALDMYNDRVYWVDAKTAALESVRTDGANRRVVLNEILKHPYGLAIFEDHIYWSDWATRSIHYCNKFTGKDHKVLTKDRKIYAVHIYHSSKQNKIPHACDRSACSHLCLLAENNSFSCACPAGMELGLDSLRCVKTRQKPRLFIGMHGNLLEMEHNTFGRHTITKTHSLRMFINELAYNNVNNSVFVADNYQRMICELDLSADVGRTLVMDNLGNISALAFDHLSYNLYWSDSERRVVEVLSLQTNHRAVVALFSGQEAPISLAVVPEDGIMFIALKGRRNSHIDQKSLSGVGEHAHVFEDGLGDDDIKFATDIDETTIYWADSDLGEISFADYRRLHALSFRKRLKRPYSIAIVGKDLFWSQLNSNTIQWTNTNSMESLKRFDIEVNQEAFWLKENPFPTRIPLTASSLLSTANHPCQHVNGGCSHICVSLGKLTSACLCPAGLVFADTQNRSCIDASDCEFRCRTGECLTMSRRCNNRRDCPDNSDEEDCQAKEKQKPKVVCRVGKFKCHNGEQCVEADEHCDGRKQCHDGSDEDHCEHFNKTTFCRHLQYPCNNGNCVDLSLMCDGANDCGDNSDEHNCEIATAGDLDSRISCGSGMFQCNSGTCIATSWECDGVIDCPDASDEHEKCGETECPSDMYKCARGQCIDKRLVCDGHIDCIDLSDENNCSILTAKEGNISCGDEQHPMYVCPSDPSKCFDVSVKCNGTAECPRGEDEADCDNSCHSFEFRCKTGGGCIRNEFRCDKEIDCADGSDEENCRKNATSIASREKPCDPNMWDCRDGKCVNANVVCDGYEDCNTGVDEGKQCDTACSGGKATCDHVCKPTPAGAVCSCFSGYKLDLDQRSCFDINECEEDPCAQMCENTHGSYRCSCHSGFMMRSDKTSCKSIQSERSLLFSTYDEIRSMSEHPTTLKVLWKANDSKVKSFDLNVRKRLAYSIIENEDVVYQINVDTGKVTDFLKLKSPVKLSVDWVTDNVYVISRYPAFRIRACSFSAKMCGTVVKVRANEIIQALAVDAFNGRLFFVSIGLASMNPHRSRIISTYLDGSKRKILLNQESSFITTLTCDPYKKMIYYSNMHVKDIQGISYRVGATRKPSNILRKVTNTLHPNGLTWYENQVFILSLGAKKVVRCYLYGTKECKTLNLNILNVEDVVVDGLSRQPIPRNPCEMAKCQGMCVLSEYSYECMCGDNIISEDQHCDIDAAFMRNEKNRNADEDQHSSYKASVFWTVFIVLLLLFSGVASILYRRHQLGQNDSFNGLHFHNPLSSLLASRGNRTEHLTAEMENSSFTTAASFDAVKERAHIGSSFHRFLHGSKSSEDAGFLLPTASKKPNIEVSAEQTQQQRKMVPTLLAEDVSYNIRPPLINYDSDPPNHFVL